MNPPGQQYANYGQQDQQFYYDQNNEGVQAHAPVRPTVPPPQGARPFVDPSAQGEVDPTAYPTPKESTNKIRGRSDILELLFSNTRQELLIAKAFYFFFFAAFGSLFPMIGVYYKQLGLNPGQAGFLIGCRPFVEFIAAPLWASMADRFHKGKIILLGAVGSWIIFTMTLGFVAPPATSCVVYNGTHYILKPVNKSPITKRSVDPLDYYEPYFPDIPHNQVPTEGLLPVLPHLYHKRSIDLMSEEIIEQEFSRKKRDIPLPPNHVVGKSPQMLHYTGNYEEFKDAQSWLSPPFSSIVYKESDVQKIFFLLLLLVLLGEFFSCPAISMADTAVLGYLGEESADQYGKQRMFGSFGWGLAMFFVGIVLDHSTDFPGHPCGPHEKERNYTICFAVFSVLMGCAFILASQFKFNHSETVSNTIPMEEVKDPIDNGPRPWNEPKIPMQQTKTGKEQFEAAIGNIKTRIYANTMKEMPEWMVVLREFKTLRCVAFLVVAWWMGLGIGLIFSLLFWHLQDYGGTPTIFGIASVINHISEIFAYFYSFQLISQIGHVKVLCLGLLGNVLRFLYISWIENPWWVLPFELMQGITHATVWAACCSYIAHNTKTELRASAQGVLQGIHHAFGRGSGAIIGGIFVNYFGTSAVFRGYGIMSMIVLGGFVFVNFYRKEGGFQHELPPEEDPRQLAEEGTALAPHGVSSGPLPRAHSSQKLNEDQSGHYGTYSTNGKLDIPGGAAQNSSTNPFAQGTGQPPPSGGGGGYQYSREFTGNLFNSKNPFLNYGDEIINYPEIDNVVSPTTEYSISSVSSPGEDSAEKTFEISPDDVDKTWNRETNHPAAYHYHKNTLVY